MTRIVILGGGTTGLLAAQGLAEIAREDEQITLVAERAEFRAAPGTSWISARSCAHFDLAQTLQRKGVGFSAAGAKRLHPERNQLELGDGGFLGYDIVLIAAGPQPAFDEVAGLGPAGYTQSLCHADHLTDCVRAWDRLLADPGPVIVGAVQGASCFAPAYESALRIDAELRRHGLREAAPITFVTPEPFLGDLGVGGIDDSQARLERAFVSRKIAWIERARVDRVQNGTMHVRRLDPQGACTGRYALRFHYSMMMPPFRGIAAVAGIQGLADEHGFIVVDETLRNPRYRNLYAAGATVAAGKSAQSHPHKSAYIIDGMVDAVLHNIREQLDGREPVTRPSWSAAHLADLGSAGLSFIADPHASLAPEHGVGAADWVHMSRCAACDIGQATQPLGLR